MVKGGRDGLDWAQCGKSWELRPEALLYCFSGGVCLTLELELEPVEWRVQCLS